MEAEIKRIIEADLLAQKRLNDTKEQIEIALKNVAKEKIIVQAEVWENAKKELESERARLELEFDKNKSEAQVKYQAAITKLESRFNEKHDAWLKELVDRCLSEGAQQ